MKHEVTVNGVKLTREQIEGALKELNAPKPNIKAGSVVRRIGTQDRYLVVAKNPSRYIDEGYGFAHIDPVSIINFWDGTSCSMENATLVEKFEVVEPVR